MGPTLEEIEQNDWGEPTYDSFLVRRCHELRRKPVDEFSVEDLRIMIGQQIGLPTLVPIALNVIEVDPLASGDFYAGDLLTALMAVDPDWWEGNQHLRARLVAAASAVVTDHENVQTEIDGFLRPQ